MNTYIEIKSLENSEVVKRLDVTGKTDRQQEQIEMGMLRNLNRDKYYTFSYDSETKLPEI